MDGTYKKEEERREKEKNWKKWWNSTQKGRLSKSKEERKVFEKKFMWKGRKWRKLFSFIICAKQQFYYYYILINIISRDKIISFHFRPSYNMYPKILS